MHNSLFIDVSQVFTYVILIVRELNLYVEFNLKVPTLRYIY